MSNITKYLQQYAEAEIHCLSQFSTSASYSNVLVIPTYKENDAFFQRFIGSRLAQQNILLIVVINQPVSDPDPLPQFTLADKIKQSGQIVWQQQNLSLIDVGNVSTDVLIIDRFTDNLRLPDKQAVGLARKIGADIATALIDNCIIGCPWICSTDADAHLPENYFSVLCDITEETSAITYNFSHINHQDAVSRATQLYQQSLDYYVQGLKWAGSNYAFHTIGSTLAFKYTHYVMVRGFPKRAAGEDFYLLNKLAKIAPVRAIDKATISIDARISDRVPFGTGPAVAKILALNNPEDDYHYYHPQLFVELKHCLKALNLLWKYKLEPERCFSSLSKPAQNALQQLKCDKLVLHIQNHASSEQQCNRHIYQWFDAFRTLKFIHYLQKLHFPAIPLNQAIAKSPFKLAK